MIYPVAMEYLSREPARPNGHSGGEKTEDASDEDILRASVSHPSLFVVLVRKYEESFLRKALSIVRQREEAEDIVQEAFAKIYMHAAKFRQQEGASFSSWAYRILINTALTHYVKRKKESGRQVELDEEIWALIPDRNLRQFEKKEIADEVASVLVKLPESLAKALGMFFLEGKTQEEIAREEGLSVGAIKTRVHRAKKEFRRVYEAISSIN